MRSKFHGVTKTHGEAGELYPINKVIQYPIKIGLLHRQNFFVIIGLSLLVILLRSPSLEQPFDNDSGAIAYHARLMYSGEPLYSTHHPGHHLPGAYYTYALAFALFGDSTWAVKFLLIPWTIITVYLLYRLGTLLMNRGVGILAAVFYAILSSHVWLGGTTAEIELFANLPRIATILLLMQLTIHQAPARKYFFVGLLSLIAFMFKAIYLSPLAVTGVALLMEWWQYKKMTGAGQIIIERSLWVGAGFVTGLLAILAYFNGLNLLSRFILVFTLGQKYINLYNTNSAGPEYWLLYPVAGLAMNNAALFIFSLAGLVIIITNQYRRYKFQQAQELSIEFYIAIWYIFSFIEAGINRAFFPHYYLLIVPPLALLAAHFVFNIYDRIKQQGQTFSRFTAPFVLILLLIPMLFLSVRQNFDYYNHYLRYKLGLGSYQDFLADGWPNAGVQLMQLQRLANYIEQHTAPSDHIYYWSEDVQLYYLTNRRAPVDIIWPIYATATGPYQRIFAPPTKYVIISYINSLPPPDWLHTQLAEKYKLEITIEDQEIYRRIN